MNKAAPTGKDYLKWLKLLLKIGITALCLWYVTTKIDFSKAGEAIGKANWLFLLFAIIAFIASKIVSAHRLNIYFRDIGIRLPGWQNVKLYWLGMFYNLFLPGSISGDAYKVILLTRKYDISYKKTMAAVLLDRFSGLLGLGLIFAVYSFFVLENKLYSMLLAAGAIIAVALFYFIVRRYFKVFISSFLSTLLLGIAVQAIQVVSIYCIMAAVDIPAHATEYVFIFLVSSVASVLPLTVGGLGIREVVFLKGAGYFGLQQETSVVISLLFYLITLLISAFGAVFIYKDPLATKD